MPIWPDPDTFNFCATSLGIMILKDAPFGDIYVTAISLSGIGSGISGMILWYVGKTVQFHFQDCYTKT